MNFKQRLFRFLIGAGIGILLSLFFFRDKMHLFTAWLPGNQIREYISTAYLSVPPLQSCILECIDMDIPALQQEVLEADIAFGESATRAEPKEYAMVFTESEKLRTARFSIQDSSATLLDIVTMQDCDCP